MAGWWRGEAAEIFASNLRARTHTHLQSESDKLRSVLSQKADSSVSTPPASKMSKAEDVLTDLQTVRATAFMPPIARPARLQKTTAVPPETHERLTKKLAVSAEPAKLDPHKATLQHHPKSAGSKQLIRDGMHLNCAICIQSFFSCATRIEHFVLNANKRATSLQLFIETTFCGSSPKSRSSNWSNACKYQIIRIHSRRTQSDAHSSPFATLVQKQAAIERCFIERGRRKNNKCEVKSFATKKQFQALF